MAVTLKKHYVYHIDHTFSFPKDRPATGMGPQGDHVTAYALFQEFVRSLQSEEAAIIVTRLLDAISNLTFNFDIYSEVYKDSLSPFEIERISKQKEIFEARIKEIFKKVEEKLLFFNTHEIDEICAHAPEKLKEKTREGLINSNQQNINRLVTYLSNQYLILNNRLLYVAFPAEGSVKASKEEGVLVKKAIKELSAYNNKCEELMVEKEKKEDEGKELKEKKPKEQESKKIKEKDKSQSSIGKAQMLGTIVSHIKNLFWYPKIPKAKLKSSKSITLSKKYHKGTQVRDNKLPTLSLVIKQHMDRIMTCFPCITQEIPFDEIQGAFIQEIAKEWNIDHEDLLKKVKTLSPDEETASSGSSNEDEGDLNETRESEHSEHTSDSELESSSQLIWKKWNEAFDKDNASDDDIEKGLSSSHSTGSTLQDKAPSTISRAGTQTRTLVSSSTSSSGVHHAFPSTSSSSPPTSASSSSAPPLSSSTPVKVASLSSVPPPSSSAPTAAASSSSALTSSSSSKRPVVPKRGASTSASKKKTYV